MLRANLNDFAEVGFGKSVIDRENKTAFQFRGDVRDPIQLRLICGLVFRRLDENKFASVQDRQVCLRRFTGIASSSSLEK